MKELALLPTPFFIGKYCLASLNRTTGGKNIAEGEIPAKTPSGLLTQQQ
jgi:hypothetical protein